MFQQNNSILYNKNSLIYLQKDICPAKKHYPVFKTVSIKNFWIVRQFNNEYNPIHWHNGHISGVGYLKLPEDYGKTIQDNKNQNFNGMLQLVHGSRSFLSEIALNIKPKVGDFYFFPNYLMHCVYPFKNKNTERRSISFNALIDDDIYDIYGQEKNSK